MKQHKSQSEGRKAFIISLGLHLLFFGLAMSWNSVDPIKIDSDKFYEIEFSMTTKTQENVSIIEEKKEKISSKNMITPVEKVTMNPQTATVNTPSQQKNQIEKKAIAGESVKVNKPFQKPTNQLKIDAVQFPFAYYLKLLQNRIQENWEPPFQPIDQKKSINTILNFKVLRNGEISDIAQAHSSGNFLFDQAARRALIQVRQLPPLPEDYPESFLNVQMEFEVTW